MRVGVKDTGPIGVIGLGLLGGAIAERLLAIGRRVVGFDLSADRRAALGTAGVTIVDSAADVCKASERVILSLPTSEVSAQVVDELMPVLGSTHILLDTTTGDPAQMASLAARLARANVGYLEVSVSGSSSQARGGEAMLMVGGDAEAFARCKDLLSEIAKRVWHVGPSGAGAKIKLVHNLVLGLNRAALAEGLTLAGALGLDGKQTLDVLKDSAAYSRAMDAKGERMLQGNFAPEARLSQHLKDVRLMLEIGGEFGIALPLARLHEQLLEQAEAAGLGALDNSAIIRVWEALSAKTLSSKEPKDA